MGGSFEVERSFGVKEQIDTLVRLGSGGYIRVSKKKVWRIFIGGKGYANLALACRALAKKSLSRRIVNQIPFNEDDYEQVINIDQVEEVLDRMFPHELGKDGMPLNCKQCRWAPSYGDGSPEFAYSWCKTARNEWISQKASEFRAQIEEQLEVAE